MSEVPETPQIPPVRLPMLQDNLGQMKLQKDEKSHYTCLLFSRQGQEYADGEVRWYKPRAAMSLQRLTGASSCSCPQTRREITACRLLLLAADSHWF